MYRVRFDTPGGGKEVLPLTWCENRETGAREWRWKDISAPRPLYNVERLAAGPDAPVLVVEGEKVVDAAEELLGAAGWIVVTWAGGAKRAGRKDTDWAPLKGRQVWIWPDRDDVGYSAALTIAEILGAQSMIVRPDPSWNEGCDIADLQAEGWDAARVLDFIEKNAVAADATPLQFKRIPIDLSILDLDIQTNAIWDATTTCNEPPSLLTSPQGSALLWIAICSVARGRDSLTRLTAQLARHPDGVLSDRLTRLPGFSTHPTRRFVGESPCWRLIRFRCSTGLAKFRCSPRMVDWLQKRDLTRTCGYLLSASARVLRIWRLSRRRRHLPTRNSRSNCLTI